MEKLNLQLSQFKDAISRLKEVLALPENDVVRDSAIQRFEFCLDLAWKVTKTFLEQNKGVICHSPKDCFRLAFQQKLIEYDDDWIKLVDLRNETVHTYDQKKAEEVYNQLDKALELFGTLLTGLSS